MSENQQFIIEGGYSLKGRIRLSGAKNASTKMLIASLLTDEECVFENCPDLNDVRITAEICEMIGSKIERKEGILKIKTAEIINHRVKELNRKNRISILALSPLLHRFGKAEVPIVGGDKIGPRPVNFHINALKEMGAEIEEIGDSYVAKTNGLKGVNVELPYPSVGATENIILAAVLAKGRTKIFNAAVEPEIIDLIKLLQKMGAIIELGTDRKICIEGVERLHGANHYIMPDRNEAVSFAIMAIATNGDIFIEEAQQEVLITFLNTIKKIGAEFKVEKNGIRFFRDGDLKPIELETDTHPGYMTDWQQPLVVLLTQANGISVIHETVYEDRFGYTDELRKMGAEITVFSKCLGEIPCRFNGKNHPHSAVIKGSTPLKGIEMQICDIRAGCAHVIASLIASGQSKISGIEHLDRGYENFEKKILSLGAKVKRI
ncbi:UDP-N-acetylglucosamine 1-carboxyvinyltransferase [Patescibacteria group bacterium]|nr:UDP-N-acetylglucosamine 1-carboxyvinyltransferase [Patescibacteria group bacterium]MBU4458643.1 UDP-N-acetylglucosamine 1-carboxyvinyltransferase [Patescibacteria group bacterium]MCG2696002.1 UDP-N-acetylglucosamine 1-carboxyvinyltransferase [Candidatus Portnoybacteria bacterium]